MTAISGPNLFAAEFKADPYPVFDKLRREAPVRPIELPTGRGWLVTRYADVRQVLADPRLSKSLDEVPVDLGYNLLPPERRRVAFHMLNADPPTHTRLRRLVAKVFTSGRVEGLRPRIREIAEELVRRTAGRGRADLVADFSFPLPITVFCELVGVPTADRDAFRAWTGAMVAPPTPDSLMAARDHMTDYLAALIVDKRRHPGDDLLSDLVAVRGEDDRLSEPELLSMAFLLLLAGFETTVNLIGNGVYLLLTHPDTYARLRADRSLIPAAVEEFLRFESPLAGSTPRVTTEPVEIGGVTIPAGELVFASLASANRDPDRYANPDRLDIDRTDGGHVAFGHGIHFCVGAPLARVEGQVAFDTLLTLLPELHLTVPADALVWRPGILMRGLVDLPVHW
ncbi:cytochrome P450 [Actinoallomurus sp. NPDC050550]|uniref:cytochrome P450 family protein n=1 Tax=Actinoallomurus sp. NPDC050550 TaxID=3154937 RepID=UPI0033CC23D4